MDRIRRFITANPHLNMEMIYMISNNEANIIYAARLLQLLAVYIVGIMSMGISASFFEHETALFKYIVWAFVVTFNLGMGLVIILYSLDEKRIVKRIKRRE